MKHTYHIHGMSCNGCRSHVEETLSKVKGVTKASVNLEKAEATIETTSYIPINLLQNAISSKYLILEKNVLKPETQLATPAKGGMQQLFPLFLIFGYITITAVLLNCTPWNGHEFMLDFMGLFYVVFSFFKFLDLKGFPESFKMYDPLAKVIPFYGWVYPFMEAGLGLMFLMRFKINSALISTLIILGITTIGVTKTLLDKKSIQCACLGTALKLPMTKATFIENSVMIVMAVIMLINRV